MAVVKAMESFEGLEGGDYKDNAYDRYCHIIANLEDDVDTDSIPHGLHTPRAFWEWYGSKE